MPEALVPRRRTNRKQSMRSSRRLALKAAPIVDILCIFNHEEALVDQHDVFSVSNELYDLEAQVDVELNSEPYDERTQIDEEMSSEPYDDESQAVHEAEVELS
ncbi:hypothetical protein Tco_0104146 [Tanacetum coccineum]